MSATIRDFVNGRKVFFVNPDTTLISEQFLFDFFSLGYECYFLQNNKTLTFLEQLEIVLRIFPDVVLIFNVDSVVPGMNLFSFIENIQKNYGSKVIIGITFLKRQNPQIKFDLERKFNYDIGIKGGCVQLEYNQRANFNILTQMLFANQAQGRRKNIRALCNEQYSYSFEKDRFIYDGELQDISLSHFSFEFSDSRLHLEVSDKIQRIQISLNGSLFTTSAILIMKRPLKDGFLYVFAYLNEIGQPGISDRYLDMLKINIYNLKNKNLSITLLKSYFLSKREDLTIENVGQELLEFDFK